MIYRALLTFVSATIFCFHPATSAQCHQCLEVASPPDYVTLSKCPVSFKPGEVPTVQCEHGCEMGFGEDGKGGRIVQRSCLKEKKKPGCDKSIADHSIPVIVCYCNKDLCNAVVTKTLPSMATQKRSGAVMMFLIAGFIYPRLV